MIVDNRAERDDPQDLIVAAFIANAAKVVGRCGIQLSLWDDFDAFIRVRSDLRNDPVTAVFDPAQTDIKSGSAFWLLGTYEGRPVQVQAVRLFDLDATLADHLYARRLDYCLPGPNIDLERSRFNVSSASRNINGRVGYHGEFWIDREFRGGGLTAVIPRIVMAMALSYQVDFLFGFQDRTVAYRGLGIKEGYMHTYMRGVRWKLLNDDWHDEAIVWMSSEDLNDLLNFDPDDVYSDVHFLNPRNRPEEQKMIALASYR